MYFKFILLLLFSSQSIFALNGDHFFSFAILGKTERVKSMLADGIDVNTTTATGRTAMMAASFNGNIRVVKVLLAYGADVNVVDNMGSTALMDAVIFGSEELVKLLITAGANVDAVDKQNISVLEKAKKTKYSNIVKILEPLVTVVIEEETEEAPVETEETSKDNKE